MALEQLDAFTQAIANIESSGGNYNAVGPNTGTYGKGLGKYQIMSKIWPAWAAEAGAAGADWRDPAMQEKVARFKMGQYYKRYGSWDLVAVAWFAGPGRANTAKEKGISAVGGLKDVLGTDVAEYVQRVTGDLKSGKAAAGGAAAEGAAALMGNQPPPTSAGAAAAGAASMVQRPQGLFSQNSAAGGGVLAEGAISTFNSDMPEEATDIQKDQIGSDTFGAILSTISNASQGKGGQILDLKSFLGMPEREQAQEQAQAGEGGVTGELAQAEAPTGPAPEAPEGLEGEFGSKVSQLLAEAGGKVHIVSGRRSRAEQEELYRRYKAGTGNLAAKPGTSNHEHGAAVDFGGDLELVAKLAPKYGLHAPVRGEPWHWELA